SWARSGGTVSPVIIRCSAWPGWIRRARRWVPPMPGQAEIDLAERESVRAGRGEAQIAGERDLEPAADAVAGDGGDEDLGRALDHPDRLVRHQHEVGEA